MALNRFLGVRTLIAAMLLASLSGCVRESDNGTRVVFSYALWVPLLIILGGFAAAGAGWAVRKSSTRLSIGGIVLSVVALLVAAPSVLRDKITIDQDRFTLQTGLWGLTAHHEVEFADVYAVRFITEEKEDSRGRTRTTDYLLFERKSRGAAKVPMATTLCEAAIPRLLQALRDHNIPFTDDR